MTVALDQKSVIAAVPGNADTEHTDFSTNPAAGGKMLVAIFSFGSNAPTSVTDNASNTYTQDLALPTQDSARIFVYRCDDFALPGAGLLQVTASWSGNTYFSVQAFAYTGLADGAPSATNSGFSSSAETSGSSGAAGGASTGLQLSILGLHSSGTVTMTPASPFTSQGEVTDGAIYFTGAIADSLNSGASDSCDWTFTNGAWYAGIVAYDADAGGAQVTGTAAALGGGQGTVAGVDRALGTLAAAGGGAGTVTGLRRALGATLTAAGGGTGSAAGIDRAVGTAAGMGGGTGTVAGVSRTLGTAAGAGGGTGTALGAVPGAQVTGTATGAGGGTGTIAGLRRVSGTAAAAGGGTGTVAGTVTDRVLGSAAAAGGGTATAAGVSRKLGVAAGQGGGAGHVEGLRIDGQPVIPGSFAQLLAIWREQDQAAEAERRRGPVACPNDGEPLRAGPDGALFCRFDGWRVNA